MPNEKLLLIGLYLKQLRIERGFLSIESFVNQYYLPRTQYWRIESGKTNLTIKSLDKILKIHDISYADFFERIDI